MDRFIKLTVSNIDSYINVSDIISIASIKTSSTEQVQVSYSSLRNYRANITANAGTNIYQFIIDNVLKANNSSKTEIVFIPENQPTLVALSFI